MIVILIIRGLFYPQSFCQCSGFIHLCYPACYFVALRVSLIFSRLFSSLYFFSHSLVFSSCVNVGLITISYIVTLVCCLKCLLCQIVWIKRLAILVTLIIYSSTSTISVQGLIQLKYIQDLKRKDQSFRYHLLWSKPLLSISSITMLQNLHNLKSLLPVFYVLHP